uniref:Smg4_UPF3 domain-containing protein n=1 Tax=Mesocestoides corti TaxID=53468 RepID=A0A5K3EK76_MESCO
MKNVPTKVVLRHLPPKLTEEHFKEMCSPIPAYDYFRFCLADPSLGDRGYCRAYINFCDPQSVFAFRERFTDYVFVDSEGNEANAIVEYAVFQGTPNTPSESKKDRRQGTIAEDPDYQSFLARTAPPSTEAVNCTDKPPEKQKGTTPWEATLELIEKREAATHQLGETPLTRFLNQRIEKHKRSGNEEFKTTASMGKRSSKANRNARKARQRQTPAAAASSSESTQGTDLHQKPGEDSASSTGGRVAIEKPPASRRGPKHGRGDLSNKPNPDASSSADQHSPLSVPGGGNHGGGRRGGGRRGGSRPPHSDGPPSYSSRHAASASSQSSASASGGSGATGPPKPRGGHRGGGPRGTPRTTFSYSRGRGSSTGTGVYK